LLAHYANPVRLQVTGDGIGHGDRTLSVLRLRAADLRALAVEPRAGASKSGAVAVTWSESPSTLYDLAP
jgi:hypothetical protein